MTNDGTQAYSYDEANRLLTSGVYSYTYSGLENKRLIVYGSFTSPSATFNLYGPDGKRLGWYRFGTSNGWTTAIPQGFSNYLYLGNKPLNYADDRIGSNRSDGTYYPYGNPYSNANFSLEDQAFGTYVQDSGSALLYADQRYYNPGYGRFMTADRSDANIDRRNPISWNRFAYTNWDPISGMDPSGNDEVDGCPDDAVCVFGGDQGGGGSSASSAGGGSVYDQFVNSLSFITNWFAPSSVSQVPSDLNSSQPVETDVTYVSSATCAGSCYLLAEPSYVSLSAGGVTPIGVGYQVSLTADQNGNVYVTPVPVFGTPGPIVTLAFGWVLGGPYNQGDLQSFVSGGSVSGGYIRGVVGVGVNISPQTNPGVSNYAIEGQIGLPGGGASGGYTCQVSQPDCLDAQ